MSNPKPTTENEEQPLEKWAIGRRPDQVQFVREYLIDLNAVQAMIRCGATEKNARSNSSHKFQRKAVQEMIAEAMSERAEALRITAKTVVGEAFRCYLGAVAAKNWGAAAKFLEMIGKHVDVRAFRTSNGFIGNEDDDEDTGLEHLSEAELLELARIKRKMAGEDGGENSPLLN